MRNITFAAVAALAMSLGSMAFAQTTVSPDPNANKPNTSPPIPTTAAPSTPPTRFTYNPVADPKKLF